MNTSRHRQSRLLTGVIIVCCVVLLSSVGAQVQSSRGPQIAAGPYRITGTIMNANNGSPLARARVTIADARNPQSTQSFITADDGRFEFHVPAGKFALRGAKRGFITGSYLHHDQFSTAIVTGSDIDSENLTLRLSPNAVIAGQVFDEFGEPVRNAQVMVYREDHYRGVSRVSAFGGTQTDDQGRYEVTPLDEGTYFVAVKASPWYAVHPTTANDPVRGPAHVDSALDVAYPVTYYGDATETADAAAIPVRGGDRLEADIHLKPVPALHLIFRQGGGNGGVTPPQLQKSEFDGMEIVGNTSIENVSPGVYEMTGVPAGQYHIRMADSAGQLKEPLEVDLANNQELDTSSGRSTSKVIARVQFVNSAAVPAQLEIGLRNNKGRLVVSAVDAKGEAQFEDLVPGTYDVVAGSDDDLYSVVGIASESGATTGRALSVPAGTSLDVLISIAGASVRIEGFAKRAGKGVSGAMIVLVPQDPEANHDHFRRDQSDLDGSFTLFNVTPGSYTIIAIENGWELDWAKPAVLARYLKHGQSVTVKDQAGANFTRLGEPVEVQEP
ncbi:MAG TPA: carboxypeptidase-like regulatory domain-containing protein [Terriglobales bacterium]